MLMTEWWSRNDSYCWYFLTLTGKNMFSFHIKNTEWNGQCNIWWYQSKYDGRRVKTTKPQDGYLPKEKIRNEQKCTPPWHKTDQAMVSWAWADLGFCQMQFEENMSKMKELNLNVRIFNQKKPWHTLECWFSLLSESSMIGQRVTAS